MLRKNNLGFTLVELLVAISIIGVLSGIILVGYNSVRSSARDAKRVADLQAVEVALQMYHAKHGTYLVSGGGWGGGGEGWLAYKDGGVYAHSVTEVLYGEELLPVAILEDPLVAPSYMIYMCPNTKNQAYSLSATKENPTAKDIAYIKNVCNGSNNPIGNTNSIDGRYGKNFAVSNVAY